MNKSVYVFIFTILFYCKLSFSQQGYDPPTIDAELIITNKVTDINPSYLYVRVSPINAIFNGNDSQQIGRKGFYTFTAKNIYDPPNVPFTEIYGNITNIWVTPASTDYLIVFFNHDGTNVRPQYDEYTLQAIGYGKYLVEFMKLNEQEELIRIGDEAYCYVDYSDGNYLYSNSFTNDLILFILKENDNYKIKFKFWEGELQTLDSIPEQDRTIKIWHQLGLNNNQYRTPAKGNFYNNYPDSLNDNEYPLRAPDSIIAGGIQLYFPHLNPGFLNQNITINRNIFSNDTLKDSLTEIIVAKKTVFKIEPDKKCTLVTPILPVLGSTNFIIQDSALLYLSSNSTITVENQNKLTFKNKGQIILWTNSEIRFKAGSLFCNEGGKIISAGTPGGIVFYDYGFHYYNCSELSDLLIEDSTRLVLEENATVQIPNNIYIHIRGNTTSLIMNPGSKLLFGENSGIVCDSGGKLIANNATFASIDSTKKWNGISLSDLSQDTIKNCTIKNAMYGICVSDKYDAEDTGIPYSTEISGCTFVNQTNYVLNNGA